MPDALVVKVSIVTEDPEEATKALEVLSRTATGLALDGIDVSFSIHNVPEATDD